MVSRLIAVAQLKVRTAISQSVEISNKQKTTKKAAPILVQLSSFNVIAVLLAGLCLLILPGRDIIQVLI